MTHEQIRLRQILAEQERRRTECQRLDGYNNPPAHQKQVAFHKSLARSRWVFGGNRSGKTECGAVETTRTLVHTSNTTNSVREPRWAVGD